MVHDTHTRRRSVHRYTVFDAISAFFMFHVYETVCILQTVFVHTCMYILTLCVSQETLRAVSQSRCAERECSSDLTGTAIISSTSSDALSTTALTSCSVAAGKTSVSGKTPVSTVTETSTRVSDSETKLYDAAPSCATEGSNADTKLSAGGRVSNLFTELQQRITPSKT